MFPNAFFSLVLLVGLCLSDASAMVLLDFAGQGSQGTLKQVGGDFEGSNILIQQLLAENTPLNSGAHVVTDGRLDFDTAENTVQITGGMPSFSIAPGSTLLSGTFTSFSFANPFQGLFSFSGLGLDEKHPDLLEAVGLNESPFTFLSFSLGGDWDPNTLMGTPTSTDLINSPVPLPSAMLLFSTGLAGLGFWRTRKSTKA